MAAANQILKGAKLAGKGVLALANAVGVQELIQLGASLTQQGIDEKKVLIEIPEIYSSDYRLKLEDAKRWLEEDGLKAEAVIVRPNIAYKDYSDLEVVATNYRLKQKVTPGTRIILKYVTCEVIEASQKLFDESERRKAEIKQEKAEKQAEKAKKKAEQAVKNKQNLDKTVANVQHGFNDVVTNTQKGIEGFLTNLPKKEKKENSKDI